MKKILLLSDTHSYLDPRILSHAQNADEIWHAGDIGNIEIAEQLQSLKPFRAVYGNIDGQEIRAEFPLVQQFELENVRVMMTHIGGYPGRYNPDFRQQIIDYRPKIFISGHSHILKVMPDKKLNLIHMNPGAIGLYGFHQKRTMLRFVLEKGDIKNLEVIEYDRT